MLKELIDKFYLDKEREKKEKERIRFWISEIGKCPRSIFFKFKQAPTAEIAAERLRVFDHGDYLHRMILKPLFSLGLVRSSEVPIPPKEIVAGKADAIVTIEGEPFVLDIKSISGRLNLEKLKEPYPEHYWQVQLYLHFFNIEKGILLYVNKDTQEIKEFIFGYKEKIAKECLNWFEKLKEKIESNIIPPTLPDYPENWQCQKEGKIFCPYFEICKAAGKGEINWEDFKSTFQKTF